MKKILLLASMLLLSGCTTAPWVATTAELDMNLSGTVAQELRKHAVSAPKAALQSIKHRESLASSKDLGKVITRLDYALEFSSIDNGMLAERRSAVFTTPLSPYDGTYLGRGKNICGLVDVINDSHMMNSQAIAVAAANSVIQTRILTNVELRTRLGTLTTSASNICLPELGSSFTYQTSTTHNRRYKDNSRNSLEGMVHSTSSNCVVDTVARPAQEINSGLRGDYMKISCDAIVGHDHKKMKITYGYLIDSQIYLKLVAIGPQFAQMNSYTDPVYAAR